ncbi:hypothetical protein BH11VER1_BH11VER1_09520 [soil metagenome]
MRILFIIISAVLLFAATLVWGIISPSYSKGKQLRSLLLNASKVSAHEYGISRHDRTYDEILTRKDLMPQQIAAISDSFSVLGWIDAGKACDFIPHHQLICTMKDGSTHLIHLCFTCGDIAIDSGVAFDMMLWEESLKKNFLEAGIPVRTESYRHDR